MKTSLWLTVAGIGALLVPARADLLYSFENTWEIGGLNGFSSLTPGAVTLVQSTHNVTDGAFSMEATWTGGFQWIGITGDAGPTIRDAFAHAAELSMDITVFGTPPTWGNAQIYINGPTTGWVQSGAGTGQKDFILDGLPHTYTWDVSTMAKPASTDTWFQFGFALNGPNGAPITYDIDNIRTTPVPEPATLAALGLGAIALARRRRR